MLINFLFLAFQLHRDCLCKGASNRARGYANLTRMGHDLEGFIHCKQLSPPSQLRICIDLYVNCALKRNLLSCLTV